jgi:hypothetical protein
VTGAHRSTQQRREVRPPFSDRAERTGGCVRRRRRSTPPRDQWVDSVRPWGLLGRTVGHPVCSHSRAPPLVEGRLQASRRPCLEPARGNERLQIHRPQRRAFPLVRTWRKPARPSSMSDSTLSTCFCSIIRSGLTSVCRSSPRPATSRSIASVVTGFTRIKIWMSPTCKNFATSFFGDDGLQMGLVQRDGRTRRSARIRRKPATSDVELNLPQVRVDRRRLPDQGQRCAKVAGGSMLCHRSQ